LSVTEEIAMTIAQKAPYCYKMAKTLISENQEIMLFARCFATQDRLEGINAFLEKRKAKFKGA